MQVFARQHRTALVGGAVAALAGFAVTAVAVAPLAPDAALLPQRLVAETVVPDGLDAQLDALASQDLSLLRSDISRGTDTAEALLARIGVHDLSAAAFIRNDAVARRLLAGRGGKMVQARTAADGLLEELVARYPSDDADRARSHFQRLTIAKVDGRWTASVETAAFGAQLRLGSGTIRSSLFAATDDAGLPDAVAVQVADIFSTEIDFHRELRHGDTFSVVYESLTADGEPVAWDEGVGRVVAAEFVNAGRAHQAVWFAAAGGQGAYYGPNGQSRRRTFLASPMAFSRITSGFAMRFHPVLQRLRAHKGVDYGAPIGTPIRVVADGVVEFAGRQNGYGNVVEVRHGKQHSTLYAHMSRIDVKKGQRVAQGQHVGTVGMTGITTGPHLHFEFRIDGVHQDPLRMARSSEAVPLDAGSRTRFAETVRRVQAKLDVAETLVGQRLRAE